MANNRNDNIETFRWMDPVERLLAEVAAGKMGMTFHGYLRWAVLNASKRIMDEVLEDAGTDEVGA